MTQKKTFTNHNNTSQHQEQDANSLGSYLDEFEAHEFLLHGFHPDHESAESHHLFLIVQPLSVFQ